MNIIKGATKPKGLRVVIYGPEGIGKSSLAAKLSNNLFFDYEDGTHGIEVDKLGSLPSSFAAVKSTLAELKRDHAGYRQITIDTADKFENILAADYSRQCKVEDIFAVNDYGRTVSAFRSNMAKVLDDLSDLANSGMNVILLAHAIQRKAEPLEGDGSYDVTELKLSKTVTPLVKEWADAIIFCAYKTFIVKTDENKSKASGGARWCFTTHTNEWTAKHRACIPLPDDCSLDKMAGILTKVLAAPVAPAAPAPAPASAPVAAAPAAPEPWHPVKVVPEPAPQYRPDIAELVQIMDNYRLTPDDIMRYLPTNAAVVQRYGTLEGMEFANLPEPIVTWLKGGMAKIAAKLKQ